LVWVQVLAALLLAVRQILPAQVIHLADSAVGHLVEVLQLLLLRINDLQRRDFRYNYE
jgi:hypothetical protein